MKEWRLFWNLFIWTEFEFSADCERTRQMKNYRDYYFLKAKAENYPARSVYKLDEIDTRFKILKPGMKILDLGASPGSWSLGAAKKIGPKGFIVACDLKIPTADFGPTVKFFQEDILHPSEAFTNALSVIAPFDLVMSDMAPATTGNKFTDQARSFELAFTAYEFAQKYLGENGNFIVKIFMGPDVEQLVKEARQTFSSVKNFKPKSSRSESKEIFLVAIKKKSLP